MKDENGNWLKATQYIARKEDFQRAVTDQSEFNRVNLWL